MKTNTFNFKKAPVSIAIDAIADDAAGTVTNFAWHDVFYAGEHVDMKGKSNAFTRDDLTQIVTNFSAQSAPLVIGHPEMDTPAYGWVSDIRLTDDNRLEIQADNVNVEFAKAVAAKAFPNRSIKVFKGKNGWQLAHVGYLGGAAPALEGMPWQFSAHDTDTTFEYALDTYAANIIVRFMRRLRELTISKQSIEEADALVPQWELDELSSAIAAESVKDHAYPMYSKNTPLPQENDVRKFTQEQLDEAVKKAVDDASASFSQQITDIKSDAEAKTKAAEDKLATIEAEQEKAAFSARVAQAQTVIDDLVKKGVLVPAQVTGTAEFMASLPSQTDATFAFSQGDKEVKETPFDFAQRFFASLATTKSPLGNEPELLAIDNNDLDAKATAYAKEHKCSYSDAVIAVSAQ